MMTPSEYFGLSIIGYATTPSIAELPAGRHEVLKVSELLSPAGKSFMTNKWFTESNRQPLYVTEMLGAKFESLEEEK